MPSIIKNNVVYTNSTTITSLTDTTITNPTSGQSLVYDATSGKWVNQANVWEGTQSAYDAITVKDPNVTYYITDTNVYLVSAGDITYNNGSSGLLASTVQNAIDEVTDIVSPIGSVVNGTKTATVWTKTWSAKGNIVLSKGSWIVIAQVLLQGDTSGYRAMNFNTTAGESTPRVAVNGVNGTYTSLHLSSLVTVSGSSTTLYLNGYHNSSNNTELSIITWSLQAMRIK